MIRTRFAPSPTGYLHIGGLRTALYAYLFSKKGGGKFILRMEDTDTEREVFGAKRVIYQTLKAAGMPYDEGPDVGGSFGPYVQSERKDIYQKHAEQLIKTGGAYYCFCAKTRLEELHKNATSKYDKKCLALSKAEIKAKLAAKEPYVIRQNIPQSGTTTYSDLIFGDITIDNKELEDGVLLKSDGMPTYNFANVVDDHLMGITHVIRGTEYLSSTPKYNHLYKAFGWPLPKYIHLQPIMRDAQNKLSKRHGDASYDDFIEKGYLSEALINYIALLGWSPGNNQEKLTMKEMLQLFSLDGISKSSSIFDEEKLKWLNAQYIRELSGEDFYHMALPFLEQLAYLKDYDLHYVCTLVQSRCVLLSDVGPLTAFINAFENFDLSLFKSDKWKTDEALARKMMPELLAITKSGFDNLDAVLDDFCTNHGYKKGQVLLVYRIAITGALVTPGGAIEIAKLLGREKTVKRLKSTMNRLNHAANE